MDPNPPAGWTITVLYDNNEYRPGLRTAWGFAALVDRQGHQVLFDTGGEAPLLLQNMEQLDFDPSGIESIVLSHAHDDHTGGLLGLLEVANRPIVYLLPSFPQALKQSIEASGTWIEVVPGQQIAEDVFTTGEMGEGIPEQALIIRSTSGLVVVTGCAHPGIVQMVERSISLMDEPVHLVLGGFHLGDQSSQELANLLQAFRDLGVEKVAPCHCSGEAARSLFQAEYGDDFIQGGVGAVVQIGP